jgi:hypothetical protein
MPYLSGDRDHRISPQWRLLEYAPQTAAHESARTTKLYDRRNDQVALDQGLADSAVSGTQQAAGGLRHLG